MSLREVYGTFACLELEQDLITGDTSDSAAQRRRKARESAFESPLERVVPGKNDTRDLDRCACYLYAMT